MRKLLKIFHGNIQASKDPSCRPSIAPRGPTTVNGFDGITSRTIFRGALSSKGNLARNGEFSLDGAFACAVAILARLKTRESARDAGFIDSPNDFPNDRRAWQLIESHHRGRMKSELRKSACRNSSHSAWQVLGKCVAGACSPCGDGTIWRCVGGIPVSAVQFFWPASP